MKNLAIMMFKEEVDHAESIFGVNIANNGWVLSFNNRKGSLGVCNYAKKTISLSSYYLDDIKQVRDTIKHEIAHALCIGDGHGLRWKNTFKRLGGSGSRTGVVKEEFRLAPKYVVVDTTKNTIVKEYHNKPTRDFSKCFANGDYSTLGKLKVFSFEDYKKMNTK